ncbi:MAG: hypothetical protein H7X93_10315 [Sphingomonadaceae bacterium]|nr:hypothetical protein [Sphingomonadaceae bacterium]
MKKMITFAAAALLSLSACQQPAREDNDEEESTRDGDEEEEDAQSGDQESDDTAAAGGKGGGAGDDAGDADGLEAQLVGGWTDDGNCQNTIEVREDRSFRMGDGAIGTWSLEGESLTLGGAAGSRTMRVTMQGDDIMVLTHPDGTMGRSTRCW